MDINDLLKLILDRNFDDDPAFKRSAIQYGELIKLHDATPKDLYHANLIMIAVVQLFAGMHPDYILKVLKLTVDLMEVTNNEIKKEHGK